jgi:hypothetical protein
MRAHTSTVYNKMAAVLLMMATDARTTRPNSCSTLAVALTSGANPRQAASVGCSMATDRRNMSVDRRKVDTDGSKMDTGACEMEAGASSGGTEPVYGWAIVCGGPIDQRPEE